MSSGGGAVAAMAATAPTFAAAGTPSFCAPAKIQILLVPASSLDGADFERWASYVRAWETVRLADVPRTSRARPAPALEQQGEVHVSFVTSYQPAHAYLAPFQMHRTVHGVLGLATCPAGRHDLGRVPGLLRTQHPQALIHRVWAFDVHASGAAADDGGDMAAAHDAPDEPEFEPEAGFAGQRDHGLLVFPAVRRDAKDVRFYVRTLLAEFIGTLLDQLDGAVHQLDEAALETPRETLRTVPRPLAERQAPPLPPRPTPSGATKMFGLKRAKPPAAPPPVSMRLLKVRADVALLSGYLWDALDLYDNVLTAAGKERALAGGQDAVWFAAALEGWAVARTLAARLGGDAAAQAPGRLYPLTPGRDKEVREPGPDSQAWRDVAEAYGLALTIYRQCLAPPHVQLESARSMTNETPRDYTPPLVYASACLSYARFLLALFASGGWNGEAFDQLVFGGVPPALDTGVPLTFAEHAHLAAVSGVYRYEIVAAVHMACTSSLRLLPAPDQLSIFSAMYHLLSLIGSARSAAHMARILSAIVSGLLAQSLAARATRPVPSIAWDEVRAGAPHVEELDGLYAHANPALVLGLVACDAYGLDILTTPLLHVPRTHILERARRRVCAHQYTELLASALGVQKAQAWLPALSASAAVARHQAARAPFGWRELQVQLLKDLLVQCESVHEHIGQLFFAVLLLRHGGLAPHDLAAVVQGLHEALPRARWHGAPDLLLRWWGPRDILRAMAVHPRPARAAPVLRSAASFAAATRPTRAEPPWIVGEPLVVDVTWHNPWPVPLALDKVVLRTTGVHVDAEPTRVTLAPGTSMSRLRVVPRAAGELQMHGCTAQLEGTEPYELCVPQRAASADEPRASGLAARPAAALVRSIAAAAPASMEALEASFTRAPPALVGRVLPALPQVQAALVDARGALRLHEGQCKHVHVRLTNTSDVAVNFVRVEWEDPTQAPMHEAMAQGDRATGEVHELEWQLLHAPVLALEGSVPQHLAPRASVDLRVTVRGRRDCSWARVNVWYGASESEPLCLRTTELTIPLCVEPSVSVAAWHVKPIAGATAERLARNLGAPPAEAWPSAALLAWDLHNPTAHTRHARLSVLAAPDGPRLSVSRALPPHSTTRVAVPWAPRALSEAALAEPMPVLMPRQYVVPKTTLSEDAQAQRRMQFWVRDEVLRSVQAQWTDGAGAEGVLSLRTPWPTPAQAECLRQPTLHIHMDAPPAADVDALVPVHVRVSHAHAGRVSVRLAAHAAIDGATTHVMVADGTWQASIAPNDTCTKTLCFLAQGMYTLTVHAKAESQRAAAQHTHCICIGGGSG
ncbi:hypothetical protein MCAP1_001509 [Malassezia caprae]|uniref:Uncharacterized protein n=1 Tax=Malassezia caprae TaxID=1381934 RepID=A0AAF0IUZ7_9BASI|nr:hypothetical protein MCAP1_001509 [Malassezia caprae]